jgi:hypothetical protein
MIVTRSVDRPIIEAQRHMPNRCLGGGTPSAPPTKRLSARSPEDAAGQRRRASAAAAATRPDGRSAAAAAGRRDAHQPGGGAQRPSAPAAAAAERPSGRVAAAAALARRRWPAASSGDDWDYLRFETASEDEAYAVSTSTAEVRTFADCSVESTEPLYEAHRGAPKETTVRHSPTGFEVRFPEEHMRATEASAAMEGHNKRVAAEHVPQQALSSLVQSIEPTPKRAAAAAAVARLLNHKSHEADGVKWVRKGAKGNQLTVGDVVLYGYGTYHYSTAKAHHSKRQLNNTLVISSEGFRAILAARDALASEALDLLDLPTGRPAAGFIVAAAYLVEEMQREAGGAPFIDGHCVNSANRQAAFAWHVDDHAEQEGGAYIEHSCVCQCSEGATSMAVAGVGEVAYAGVGGVVRFPAWALHRTMLVASSSAPMWKIAAFFGLAEPAAAEAAPAACREAAQRAPPASPSASDLLTSSADAGQQRTVVAAHAARDAEPAAAEAAPAACREGHSPPASPSASDLLTSSADAGQRAAVGRRKRTAAAAHVARDSAKNKKRGKKGLLLSRAEFRKDLGQALVTGTLEHCLADAIAHGLGVEPTMLREGIGTDHSFERAALCVAESHPGTTLANVTARFMVTGGVELALLNSTTGRFVLSMSYVADGAKRYHCSYFEPGFTWQCDDLQRGRLSGHGVLKDNQADVPVHLALAEDRMSTKAAREFFQEPYSQVLRIEAIYGLVRTEPDACCF